MTAPSTPQQHCWELWDSITVARLQKIPTASSYAVFISNGRCFCSEPPAPSQGSPADARWDISPLLCFSQPTALGWGGSSAPLPVPAGASAFGRASPPQGLCGSGRLECGQHSRCSPPTDARRRTEAAFLRRGLAPRARRSLQELPCFPLRGVSAGGKSQTTAVPSCEASALPPWAGHAVGSTRGWEGRREYSAFCSCTQHPTHPWMLKGQIQLLQSTRYPRSEPPPGGWEIFPFSQAGSISKAAWSPLSRVVGDALPALSGYGLAAGWGGAAGEVSSAPAAACETEGTSAPAAAAAVVPAPRHPLPPVPRSGAQGCGCLPPPPRHPSSAGPAAHTRSL